MKIKLIHLVLLFTALLMTSCQGLPFLDQNIEIINPSAVIITETREVSNFTKINISAFGKVNLLQGESEFLSITGSDNVVPVIQTRVRAGTLEIQHEKNVNIIQNNKSELTFNITVKDLNNLTISGAADVEMGSLSTSELEISMSGAGQFVLDQLSAESLEVNFSGLGNVEVSGEVMTSTIDISGAGNLKAADLKTQSTDISISGMGNATVWVTEQLTGNISGGGNVSYYGDPQTDFESTGMGQFKSLGSK